MIYDEPRFLPGGDRFVLIELGNEMSLDLNFVAHGLAHAIAAERVKGVIETAPAYASLLVHYDPGEVSFDRLTEEVSALARSLGSSDAMTLESRLFYFPTAYLDPWSAEAVDRYIAEVAEKPRDPELLVASNGLNDVGELVRIHAATEYWVAAIGWWPGVPFMMPLDPRCRLTAPRYNPPAALDEEGNRRGWRRHDRHLSGGPAGRHPDLRPHSRSDLGPRPAVPDIRGLDLPAAPRRSCKVHTVCARRVRGGGAHG